MSDSVGPHRRQPTRLPCPGDSPGKNTGVGCHFLLQCMKVKSESEVSQSCPTLRDPVDCSPPGSSVHGIFQARVLEWGAIAFSESMLDNIKHFWEVFFFNPCKKLTHKNEDVLSQSLFLLTYCSHSFSNANHIQLKISVDFTYKLSHYLGPFLRRNRLS